MSPQPTECPVCDGRALFDGRIAGGMLAYRCVDCKQEFTRYEPGEKHPRQAQAGLAFVANEINDLGTALNDETHGSSPWVSSDSTGARTPGRAG